MWRRPLSLARGGQLLTRFTPAAVSFGAGQLSIARRRHSTPPGGSKSTAAASSGSLSTTTSSSPAEEDREDLERERQLREKFAQKMSSMKLNTGGGAEAASGGNSFFTNMTTTSANSNHNSTGNAGGNSFFSSMMPPPPQSGSTRRMSSFTLLVLMTFLMLPLLVLQPMMKTMSGVTWHEVPVLTSAYYLLLRTIASREDQARIQKEYAAASRTTPQLTLDQFMNQHYPTLFQGYRTSQQELVAAVGTCLTAEDTIGFVRTMSKAAGMARDPKAAADRVMEALQKDYSKNFQV